MAWALRPIIYVRSTNLRSKRFIFLCLILDIEGETSQPLLLTYIFIHVFLHKFSLIIHVGPRSESLELIKFIKNLYLLDKPI